MTRTARLPAAPLAAWHLTPEMGRLGGLPLGRGELTYWLLVPHGAPDATVPPFRHEAGRRAGRSRRQASAPDASAVCHVS